MNQPDVLVVVQGGVADVEVRTPNIVVEVRDYDVDGVDDELLGTDENWDQCVRYFQTCEGESPAEP